MLLLDDNLLVALCNVLLNRGTLPKPIFLPKIEVSVKFH